MFQRIKRALGFVALQGLEPRRLMASGGVKVAAGDLNGDGFADLAIIHRDLATRNVLLTTHLNDRKSGPGPTRASVSLTEAEYTGIVIADVNRDGRPDIVVVVNGGGRDDLATSPGGGLPHVKIFAGDGEGGFATDSAGQPLTRTWTLPGGVRDTYGVAAGDLDGDGSPEIIVNYTIQSPRDGGSGRPVGRVAGGVSVFWSAKAGEPRKTVAEPVGNKIDENCDGIAVGDLDGDGSNEIIAYPSELNLNQPPQNQPDTHVIKVRRNQEQDTQDIARKTVVQLNHHGSSTSSNPRYQSITFLGVGDLNGDGRAELIGLASSGDGSSDVYTTGFDEKASRWKAPELNSSSDTHRAPSSSTASAIGDLNGDGLADIVTYSPQDEWSFGVALKDGSKLVWSPKSNVFLYGGG